MSGPFSFGEDEEFLQDDWEFLNAVKTLNHMMMGGLTAINTKYKYIGGRKVLEVKICEMPATTQVEMMSHCVVASQTPDVGNVLVEQHYRGRQYDQL